MMAIAAWLVCRQTGFAGTKLPLALFGIQIVLNSVWSLFFRLQNPGAQPWRSFYCGQPSW